MLHPFYMSRTLPVQLPVVRPVHVHVAGGVATLADREGGGAKTHALLVQAVLIKAKCPAGAAGAEAPVYHRHH